MLRSLGDSTPGAINALQHLLDRPDYGDGRLFLTFQSGSDHSEQEEMEYFRRLERTLVTIFFAPVGTVSMGRLIANFGPLSRFGDGTVTDPHDVSSAAESQFGVGGGQDNLGNRIRCI